MISLLSYFIAELEEGHMNLEQKALGFLQAADYSATKHCCSQDLISSFLSKISSIASAYQFPKLTAVLLQDTARHIADVLKKQVDVQIAEQFKRS